MDFHVRPGQRARVVSQDAQGAARAMINKNQNDIRCAPDSGLKRKLMKSNRGRQNVPETMRDDKILLFSFLFGNILGNSRNVTKCGSYSKWEKTRELNCRMQIYILYILQSVFFLHISLKSIKYCISLLMSIFGHLLTQMSTQANKYNVSHKY